MAASSRYETAPVSLFWDNLTEPSLVVLLEINLKVPMYLPAYWAASLFVQAAKPKIRRTIRGNNVFFIVFVF